MVHTEVHDVLLVWHTCINLFNFTTTCTVCTGVHTPSVMYHTQCTVSRITNIIL